MKSMREVDMDTYSLSLLTAKEDILNPRSSTNWALFTYDGIMNRLKLADSGVGGLKELTTKLHPGRTLYGMCRVGKAQPRIAMILWVGHEVDEYRRAECASHLPAIRAFFKEVHIFLPAHTLDEITEERICTLAYSAAAVTQGPRARPSRRTEDRQAIVGTNYKRTIAAAEIQKIHRDSFWAKAEREEEERKKEEQRRAAEDRRQREKERLLQEKRDAMERERRMNEKEQKIKEQRRIHALMEAEAQKREKMKWEHEEREREEEEIRARYSRSQSEEKAAEAAALVSQRALNPREFFRQLSSSSLHTASSSTSPVRSPYRRLYCSQTDNIFSFNESLSTTPTSPYRPSVVSQWYQRPTTRSPVLFTNTSSSLQNGAIVSNKSQIQLSPPKMVESQLQTQLSPQMMESQLQSSLKMMEAQLQTQPSPQMMESQLQTQPSLKMMEAQLQPQPSLKMMEAQLQTQPSLKMMEAQLQTQPSLKMMESQLQTQPSLKMMESQLQTQPSLKMMEAQLQTQPSLKMMESQLQTPPSPQMMEAQLQTHPSPSTSPTESVIKSPISELLDSLVFYPPPPTPELLQPDEPELVEEFPPPPPGFESSPEPSVNQLETLDEPLDPLLPPSAVVVPEPPTKPLPDLPITPRMLKDLEVERDFTARASVISTVEEEDEGNGDKEMKYDGIDVTEEEEEKRGGEESNETGEKKNRGQEEHDGMIVKKHESEKETNERYESGKEKQDENIMEEHKSEEDKVVEESESEKIMEEQVSERIILECVQETELDWENTENPEEDGKDLEKHESETNMEEYKQDGNIVEAFEEQAKKNMEVFVTEGIQYVIIVDECEEENEQEEKIIEKCKEEHDSDKEECGECMEEPEVETIQDASILEIHRKEQDWEIIETYESEKIQCMREEEEDVETVGLFDNEREQDNKSSDVSETDKIQCAKMEECEQENEQDGKTVEKHEGDEGKKEEAGDIMKEHEDEKTHDRNITEEHEKQENAQDGKTEEKCEEYKSEKETDRKIMEEYGSKEQDRNIMNALDSDKEQDETSVDVFETEKLHYVTKMEECGQENVKDIKKQLKENDKEQDCNVTKDPENEKTQDGDREENKIEKDEGWKVVEVYETEKIQYVKIIEECKEEKNQDGNAVETYEHGKSLAEYENDNKPDSKTIEDCGSEKINDGEFIEECEGEEEDWKVVEVFEQENKQDRKECEEEDDDEEQDDRRVEEQDWKMMEASENEKEQDCKIEEMREDEKSLEEQRNEKDQVWEMTENCANEKIQYANITEEHESENKHDEMTENRQEEQNQNNDRKSHVDIDKAVSVTVLRKEESYTEVIKRDEATEAGAQNEKEPLIQTEEADTVFSQHAPLLPESHSTDPSPINDACIPETISTTQDKNEPKMCSTDTSSQINAPTIQVRSDLSRLNDQSDSDLKEKNEPLESQASSEISKNTTSGGEQVNSAVEDEQTDAEMLREDTAVDSCNDLSEGVDAESVTSPLSENQASTGQSDEGEGLAPAEDTVGLKNCITHQPDTSDVEEGEEAISVLLSYSDVKQNLKYDSESDQVNEDHKHDILVNCETIVETPNNRRNDKTADEK